MFFFGVSLSLSDLIYFISKNAEQIFIGKYFNEREVGYYTKGYGLFLMPINQLIWPFGDLAIPALSRLIDTAREYKKYYFKLVNGLSLVISFISIYLIINGDNFIIFLFGETWIKSGEYLQILSWGGVVGPLSGSISWLLISQGRGRDMFKW